MVFFHGKIELKDLKNCSISLPIKWEKDILASQHKNQYNLIIVKLIFLDEFKADKYIYVTWNGSKNCTDDSIFLDKSFAKNLKIIDQEPILIQLVNDHSQLSSCSACCLQPLSNEDYQMIEMNREEIEYEFLNQIRIITIAFIKNDEFIIYPLWLKSSMNLPVFIKIVRVEPSNKTGLIMTNNTIITIIDPNTNINDSFTSNDADNSDNLNSSHSLSKSVFGLIKSFVHGKDNASQITPSTKNQSSTLNIKSYLSFPLYQGDNLFMRVILIENQHDNIDSHNKESYPPIAFISSTHFNQFKHLGCEKNHCIMRLKKLKSYEKQEQSVDIMNPNYDKSLLSMNEQFCTSFLEKYVKIHKHLNELPILVYAKDDCPDDSIMFSRQFIEQYSLPFLSYIILDQFDLKNIDWNIEKKDDINYVMIPIVETIFFVSTINYENHKFTGDNSKNVVKKILEKSPNNNIFLMNGYLINNHHDHHEKFIVIQPQMDQVAEDFDKEMSKLSTSFFLIDSSTKIIVQRLPHLKHLLTSFVQHLNDNNKAIKEYYHENFEKIQTKPFAGRSEILKKCIDCLEVSLNLDKNDEFVDRNSFTTLLITGQNGSGKTTLIEKIMYELCKNYFIWNTKINCSKMKGKRIESIQKSWSKLFNEAINHQPSIMIFENFDQIAYESDDDVRKQQSADNSSNDSNMKQSPLSESFYCERISHVFIRLIDSLKKLKSLTPFSRIAIIITAQSYSSLNNVLKKSFIFDTKIDINKINGQQRIEIMNEMFDKKYPTLFTDENNTKMKTIRNIDMKSLSKITKYFTIKQMDTFVDMIVHSSIVDYFKNNKGESIVEINDRHVNEALDKWNSDLYRPNDLKLNTKRTFKDIGGMSKIKEVLSDTILLQLRYPKLYRHLPLKLPNSLLIYGMPGCGKTAIVEAIANEANINFISVKGPELLSKYIGNSEQSVRRIFRKAQDSAPCILFFDEFDSLAPRRGHDSTGVTDRVVNQMLTLMDGLEERKQNIFIIAATSRPDLIDLALLRPGRFDQIVECQLPDENERKEIFMVLGKKLLINNGDIDNNSDIDEMNSYNQIVKSTENFTGADIQALLYNTYLESIKQTMYNIDNNNKFINQNSQNDDNNNNINNIKIKWINILQSLNMTSSKPSLNEDERNRFKRIYKKFQAELSGKTLADSNDNDGDDDRKLMLKSIRATLA